MRTKLSLGFLSRYIGILATIWPGFLFGEIIFETLGTLPGSVFGESEAFGVNANGSVVVGVNYRLAQDFTLIQEAFRWKDGVMTGLGDLPGGNFESYAEDVSADGSVVVGWSDGDDWWHAFRWENGVMTDLGARWAKGVSGDGRVVVGSYPYVPTGAYEAVKWVDGVMTPLGDLPGGSKFSQAWGISDDGKVIVGGGEATGQTAFRWEDGVMISLEEEPGMSRAFAVNSDGSVVVGEFARTSGDIAFRWVDGVLNPLNGPPDWFSIQAQGVSGDGFTVAGVGIHNQSQRDTALMWTQQSGFLPVILNEFLDQNGVERGSWYLETAMAVSTDGSTITGRAVHPDSGAVAYRLRLWESVDSWAGFSIDSDGRSVNTGGFIGWIDIARIPWVFSYSLQSWIYLPEERITPAGAWAYIGR